MTMYGAIAEGERRCRELGKSYNISRHVHARDYIVQEKSRPLPIGYITIAIVHDDGVVQKLRAE